MQIILLILLCLTILLLVVLLVLLIKRTSHPTTETNHDKEMFDYLSKINESNNKALNEIRDEFASFRRESTGDIQNSYSSLLKLVTDQLNAMNMKVDANLKTGFEANTQSMKEITFALGQLSEAQKNLDSLSTQVNTLNSVLTNSQQRGRFGEVALNSLLSHVYGDTHGLYETQYVLPSGVRPDAVVFLPEPDKLVCIDSKFSFVSYAKLFVSKDENEISELRKTFKAALKSQVTKIANDYIHPGQTSNYAIMFIPSDGIYAFLQSNDDFYESIIEYSRSKNVILTSPSTLQPILANIRMLQVNYEVSRNIRGILAEIQKLRKENLRFYEDWGKVSSTIETLNKKKDEFDKRVASINQKTDQLINQASQEHLLENENDGNDIKVEM